MFYKEKKEKLRSRAKLSRARKVDVRISKHCTYTSESTGKSYEKLVDFACKDFLVKSIELKNV